MNRPGPMKNKSERLFDVLQTHQLIALLSPKSDLDCVKAYDVLSPLGVVLEIAFRTESALKGIQAILKHDSEALVLAGTVLTRSQTEDAIRAGAAGIVSPDYLPEVVDACVNKDVLCVPGGHGDVGKQLIQKARLYGLNPDQLRERKPWQWIFKLFPTVTKEVSYTGLSKAWKGVYKGLHLVYTGGLSSDNLGEIVRHDPDGFFCGSALTKRIDDPCAMQEEAERWKQIVQQEKMRS